MKKIITLLLILSVSLLYAQENNDNDTENDRPELPAGYGDVNWGDRLSTARDNIKGRLSYTDEQTIIISRDGEIVYHYGFFYVDPAEFPPDDEENGVDAAENDEFFDEGELFFVKLNFPYLSRKDIEEKIVERYGPPTFEDIRNDEGALAWDSDQTVIVMWIDTYEGEPFCRRITYMGKEIAQRLNEHQQRVFHKTELEILERLEP